MKRINQNFVFTPDLIHRPDIYETSPEVIQALCDELSDVLEYKSCTFESQLQIHESQHRGLQDLALYKKGSRETSKIWSRVKLSPEVSGGCSGAALSSQAETSTQTAELFT